MSHVYDNLTHRENKRRQTDHLRPHDLDPDDVATATGPRTQVKDFDRHLDGWLDDLEGRLAPAGRQTPQRGPDDHTVPETALGDSATAHGSRPWSRSSGRWPPRCGRSGTTWSRSRPRWMRGVWSVTLVRSWPDGPPLTTGRRSDSNPPARPAAAAPSFGITPVAAGRGIVN